MYKSVCMWFKCILLFGWYQIQCYVGILFNWWFVNNTYRTKTMYGRYVLQWWCFIFVSGGYIRVIGGADD